MHIIFWSLHIRDASSSRAAAASAAARRITRVARHHHQRPREPGQLGRVVRKTGEVGGTFRTLWRASVAGVSQPLDRPAAVQRVRAARPPPRAGAERLRAPLTLTYDARGAGRRAAPRPGAVAGAVGRVRCVCPARGEEARKTRRFGRRMPRVGFTFRPPDARYVSTPLHSSALKRACGTQCAAAARGRHPALRHLSGPQDLSLEPSSPVLGL